MKKKRRRAGFQGSPCSRATSPPPRLPLNVLSFVCFKLNNSLDRPEAILARRVASAYWLFYLTDAKKLNDHPSNRLCPCTFESPITVALVPSNHQSPLRLPFFLGACDSFWIDWRGGASAQIAILRAVSIEKFSKIQIKMTQISSKNQ